jgi:hypothetical protein
MAMRQMRAHLARRSGDSVRPPVPRDADRERHQPRVGEGPRQRLGLHRRRYGHDPAEPARAGRLVSPGAQESGSERPGWRRFFGFD